MKLIFLSTFVLIFCLNQAASQSVKCEFKNIDLKKFRDIYYGCYLKKCDHGGINELHIFGKFDSDVKMLYGNKLMNFPTFPSIFCEKFKKLKIINYIESSLEFVDKNSFVKCKNVEEIYLSVNKIEKISGDVFASQTKLIKLYLNKNQINELGDGLFDALENLEELSLTHNKLTTLKCNFFTNLSSLKRLSLILSQTIEELKSHNQLLYAEVKNLKDDIELSKINQTDINNMQNTQNIMILNTIDNLSHIINEIAKKMNKTENFDPDKSTDFNAMKNHFKNMKNDNQVLKADVVKCQNATEEIKQKIREITSGA